MVQREKLGGAAHRPWHPDGDTRRNRVAVTLSWSAPTNNGGEPINQYVVQWRLDSNNNWSTDGPTGSKTVTSGTSVTLTDAADNLQPGTTYNFRYRADNRNRVSFFNVNDGSIEATTIDQVTASVGNAAANEGNAVSFTVTLSAARSADVTLNWATSNGSATAPADYTATSSGTVTVTAGQTTATFTVQTANDALDENDETFTVTLSNPPTNVVLDDATATGTIRDDDPLPVLSANSPRVQEGDTGETPMTFTFTLTPASGRTVTLDTTVGNTSQTATTNVDFTRSVTRSFPDLRTGRDEQDDNGAGGWRHRRPRTTRQCELRCPPSSTRSLRPTRSLFPAFPMADTPKA